MTSYRLQGSYNADSKIESRLKGDSYEGYEGYEGSSKKEIALEEQKLQESIEISQDNIGNDVDIIQDHAFEDIQTPQALSQEPSQPSLPSLPSPIEPCNGEDKDKVLQLKEYDRLSALSRKKSKSASQINDAPLNENLSGDKHDPQAKPPSGGIG